MAAKNKKTESPESPGASQAETLSATASGTRPGLRPADASPDRKKQKKRGDGTRETVESIAIAFVLAFLFKTFQAEAYVIPTGSMAPTLYGRHKEVTCDGCGFSFALGASSELEQETGLLTSRIRHALCSNCGKSNDVMNAPVFNGDRILVNKQVPAFNRFDVVVFKNPEQGHVNYIKRLVGLPNETLRIRKGDLWVRKKGEDAYQIQRKEPSVQKDIQLTVYDDRYPPQLLLDAGWLERWNSVDGSEGANGGWTADRTARTYSCAADTAEPQWLRYTHFFDHGEAWRSITDLEEWLKRRQDELLLAQLEEQQVEELTVKELNEQLDALKEKLAEQLESQLQEQLQAQSKDLNITPRATLIADFCSFNAYSSGFPGSTYWVGDLTINATVEISAVSPGASMMLELVEGPTLFQCAIDLTTGEAKLVSRSTSDPSTATSMGRGQTDLKGIGVRDVAFANVDDRLCLWVAGDLVEFNGSTEYQASDIPQPTEKDLAPCGIAFSNAAATVSNLLLQRDIYYRNDIIAFDPADGLSEAPTRDNGVQHYEVPHDYELQAQLHNPEAWARIYAEESAAQLAAYGKYGEYVLAEDEYLMFGDNSSMSKDSRLFDFLSRPMNGVFSHRYAVREQDLIGKALFIFWPHGVPFLNNGKGIAVGYHSSDKDRRESTGADQYPSIRVPFYPDFSRMKKIR